MSEDVTGYRNWLELRRQLVLSGMIELAAPSGDVELLNVRHEATTASRRAASLAAATSEELDTPNTKLRNAATDV